MVLFADVESRHANWYEYNPTYLNLFFRNVTLLNEDEFSQPVFCEEQIRWPAAKAYLPINEVPTRTTILLPSLFLHDK
jgi:hypothetical protein